MTSPDGINWTLRTSPANNNYWTSVCNGNGMFVAVARTGTGNRAMKSSVFTLPSVSIAADPGNSIAQGATVTFTATPINGGTTLAYQWKKNGTNVGMNQATYTDAT